MTSRLERFLNDEKDKKSLPYHNRNLNLPPLSEVDEQLALDMPQIDGLIGVIESLLGSQSAPEEGL